MYKSFEKSKLFVWPISTLGKYYQVLNVMSKPHAFRRESFHSP